MLVEGVEARIDDPEALRVFLKRIRNVLENDWVHWHNIETQMRAGDQLFYFEYEADDYQDQGVMITREGTILFRKTLSRSWDPKKGDPPLEYDFDRLEQENGGDA